MRNLSRLAILLVCVALPRTAAAAMIGFDNVTSANVAGIPNGYGGFNWSALFAIRDTLHPGSGYDLGTVSPSYTAFGGGSGILTPGVITSATPFTFNSVYLTAAWSNNLTLFVAGFNGATQIYAQTLTLNDTVPTLFQPNWTGINKITFLSSSDQYVLDNLTVNESVAAVPEPATMTLVALGLAGAGVRRWRQKRA